MECLLLTMKDVKHCWAHQCIHIVFQHNMCLIIVKLSDGITKASSQPRELQILFYFTWKSQRIVLISREVVRSQDFYKSVNMVKSPDFRQAN